MKNPFGRHNIVGSEAGKPRPMVYLRRERRQLRRRRRRGLPVVIVVAVALAAVLVARALLGA